MRPCPVFRTSWRSTESFSPPGLLVQPLMPFGFMDACSQSRRCPCHTDTPTPPGPCDTSPPGGVGWFVLFQVVANIIQNSSNIMLHFLYFHISDCQFMGVAFGTSTNVSERIQGLNPTPYGAFRYQCFSDGCKYQS